MDFFSREKDQTHAIVSGGGNSRPLTRKLDVSFTRRVTVYFGGLMAIIAIPQINSCHRIWCNSRGFMGINSQWSGEWAFERRTVVAGLRLLCSRPRNSSNSPFVGRNGFHHAECGSPVQVFRF